MAEAARKRSEHGGFDRRIFLEYVEPGRLNTARGADPIPNGLNHGPFGENDLVVPNRHWLYGPSRAMWRVLPPRREKTG